MDSFKKLVRFSLKEFLGIWLSFQASSSRFAVEASLFPQREPGGFLFVPLWRLVHTLRSLILFYDKPMLTFFLLTTERFADWHVL